VSDDTHSRQAIPNLERKLIEVEIRIEKVALVLAPSFECKVFPVLFGEEVLLSRGAGGREM
jgi:hypothetical protein